MTRESLWLSGKQKLAEVNESLDSDSTSSPQRAESSTAAHLLKLCDKGQLDEALSVVESMDQQGIVPSLNMYSCLVKACARRRSLPHAKRLLGLLRGHGLDSTRFFGENMVCTMVKCGDLDQALSIFDSLPYRTVFSWTAVISGYTMAGQGKEALGLYTCMLEESVEPDRYTFVSLITACGGVSELGEGKRIHAEALRYRFGSDMFVCTSLVDMYAKCGSIVDAQNVFDALDQRDVVSWNAMVAAYAQQGEAEKALQLYEQMREEGASPNHRTFVSALQACATLAEAEEGVVLDGYLTRVKSITKGRELHGETQRKGYVSDIFVDNALISMYGKCGSFVDACNVFEGMGHQDAVSWTAMLSSYVLQDQGSRALQLYAQMLEEGVSADALTIIASLQACSSLAENEEEVLVEEQLVKTNALGLIKALHTGAVIRGHGLDTGVVNTLVSMYGKCGGIADAKRVFDELANRTVVSWNALLSAYVEQGEGEKALQLYRQMSEDNISPNDITLVYILQACSSTGSLKVCRQIHHSLVSTGNEPSPALATTLIHVYGRCASMQEARGVFDAIRQPTVVSWNALIAGYARQGSTAASLQCYEEMRSTNVNPNSVTFLALLSICSHAGLVDEGVGYFESMSRDFGITPETEHVVCMVDLFGRAGCFERIEELLSKTALQPNLVMWLCLLGACRKHGKVALARRVFDCVVLLQPKHAAAYELMSNIYADAGLWHSASEVNELKQKAGAWKKPSQSWIQHDQDVHAFHVGDSEHLQEEVVYELIRKVSTVLKESTEYSFHRHDIKQELVLRMYTR